MIIATYDRRSLIGATVRSALEQPLPPGWERGVVISDDGSRDGTVPALVQEFDLDPDPDLVPERELSAWSGEDLILLSGPNRERGAARNRGARAALEALEAGWLLFLDSDDRLAEGSLRGFARRIEALGEDAEEVAAVYANWREWDGGGEVSPPVHPPTAPEGDLRREVLERPLFAPGATLVRASAFLGAGGFSEDRRMSGSEDWHLWCRLTHQGPIRFSDHVSFHYRKHGSGTPPERFQDSVVRSRADLVPFIEERFGPDAPRALRMMHARKHLILAGNFSWARRGGAALRELGRAVRIRPGLLTRPSFWKLLATAVWRGWGSWSRPSPDAGAEARRSGTAEGAETGDG